MLTHAPGELGGEAVRQDLHVARENDEIGLGRLDDLPGLGLLLHLGLPCDRQGVEGNVAEVDMVVGLARIIGDDRDRLHPQFAAAPAIEQIDQAVIEARDHAARRASAGRPGASTISSRNPRRSSSNVSRRASTSARAPARVEHDPHEEVAGLDVVELLGVENVEAAVEQRGRDFGDDPGPVDARQGENVACARHEAPQGWHGSNRRYRFAWLRSASTEGRIFCTMTSTPSAFGCRPSVWLSFASPATPSRKNG